MKEVDFVKVEYFKNEKLVQKEVNTLEELESIGRTVLDSDITLIMNGYEYSLAKEENAPLGKSNININYLTVDEVRHSINTHNLTQLKDAIETVQKANVKDMFIHGVLFNDIS